MFLRIVENLILVQFKVVFFPNIQKLLQVSWCDNLVNSRLHGFRWTNNIVKLRNNWKK